MIGELTGGVNRSSCFTGISWEGGVELVRGSDQSLGSLDGSVGTVTEGQHRFLPRGLKYCGTSRKCLSTHMLKLYESVLAAASPETNLRQAS